MRIDCSELELDALRELTRDAAARAAAALSERLGMPIEVAVAAAYALPAAGALAATGRAELPVTGVAIALDGDLAAIALVLLREHDVATLCFLLGLEPDSEHAASALEEVVEALADAYLLALAGVTGLSLAAGPPQHVVGTLGEIVGSLPGASAGDAALMLDAALVIAAQSCAVSLLLVPAR
ncbi:MAG TPA: hypothetical protein VG474_08260 [Solirubrobacteraceae bacterium]|nr:hypothetical protein [Solirubrobacteraceae bacterium]